MNIEIANRLVKLRKAHNLSQEELANKLGISRQAVSKWERAEASPDTDNLITLAKLYNVSLDELLYSEEDEIDKIYRDNPLSDRPLLESDFIDESNSRKQITIDKDLISITLNEKDNVNIIKKSHWDTMPYPILMAIAFFILGFAFELWHIAWLVFLTIPLYYSLIKAIRMKNMNYFAFPVLAGLIYLLTGLLWGWWRFAWIVFLFIPVYYGIGAAHKH